MAKLENYSGSIDLISGLRQKNNGDFPLLTAHDVQVDENGKRLDEKLAELDETAGVPGKDGKDGTSVTITDISESTESGGSNVVTFSDGKKLTVKNGKQGADGKNGTKIVYTEGQYSDVSGTGVVFTYHDIPVSTLEVGDFIVSQGNLYQVNYIVASGYQSSLIVKMQGEDGKDGKDYILTEADKTEIAENVKGVCIPKNQGVANVGKILVVGTDGNLTLADMPEGGASGDVIGTLDESNNILLSGNLADGTYTLKYENANGTYTEIGTLEVGEIEEPEPEKTNFFVMSGEGYILNGRCGNDGTDRTGASQNPSGCLSNYFAVMNGDIISVENVMGISELLSGVKFKDNTTKGFSPTNSEYTSDYSVSNGIIQFTVSSENVAYLRLTLTVETRTTSKAITAEEIESANIIINIKRNGEWL